MTPATFRFCAAATICAALLAGVATRAERAPPDSFAGLPALRPGEPVGEALFERFEDDAIPVLRLRVKGCGDPVFALPILLTAVATIEVADVGYLTAGYRIADVYRASVRESFSHLHRLIARAAAGGSNGADGFFVRFYAPRACDIANPAFVSTAQAILRQRPAAGKTAEAKGPRL